MQNLSGASINIEDARTLNEEEFTLGNNKAFPSWAIHDLGKDTDRKKVGFHLVTADAHPSDRQSIDKFKGKGKILGVKIVLHGPKQGKKIKVFCLLDDVVEPNNFLKYYFLLDGHNFYRASKDLWGTLYGPVAVKYLESKGGKWPARKSADELNFLAEMSTFSLFIFIFEHVLIDYMFQFKTAWRSTPSKVESCAHLSWVHIRFLQRAISCHHACERTQGVTILELVLQ